MPDGDFDEVKRLIADVPGWLADEEAKALYGLAKQISGRGVIVEIGSWKGRSTICLARGSRAGSGTRVYAIDPHTDYRFGEFKENIERAGVADLVVPIASLSQPAAADFSEPIELLWIDGSHEYELVRQDFERWVPKVIEGGWVAMHDTTWIEGSRRVADELLYRSRHFHNVRFVPGSTSVGQKVLENTWTDRLRNRYLLALKAVFAGVTRVLKQRRDLIPSWFETTSRRVLSRLGSPHNRA